VTEKEGKRSKHEFDMKLLLFLRLQIITKGTSASMLIFIAK